MQESRLADPLDWHDVLPFGKYRGEMVGEVFDKDPSYLHWLMNTTSVRFVEAVADAIDAEVPGG